MRYYLFIIIVLISGCAEHTAEITGYKCNDKQLDLVNKEFDICVKSSFLSTYCFEQAKTTICDKIETHSDTSE